MTITREIRSMRNLTRSQARRATLGALGFARPRPSGRVDARHFRRVYDDLGVVQIDPINVVARAHHQVFMSRLGPYDTAALDNYVWRSGEVYEGWIHVDATAPVEVWPLLEHRRAQSTSWRGWHAGTKENAGFVDQVLAEIAERGELTAAQLTDSGPRHTTWAGQSSRSLGRAALDYLHHRGDLLISWRDDRMTCHFDLPERVVPPAVLDVEAPPVDEAQKTLLRRAISAMAVGTAADAADWYRLHIPTARRQMEELADAGAVRRVQVEGWDKPAYADPNMVIPRRIEAAALINPFDPLVWNRDRTARMFDLEYRIEIYVPAEKRKFGYYALPFLLDEELVALVDLKHDRATGRLLVAQFTPLVAGISARSAQVRGELEQWATWLACESAL